MVADAGRLDHHVVERHLEHPAADRTEEADVASREAGDADLVHQHQQGVAVAVDAEIDQSLDVAGGVALAPGRLARARPVADAAGPHGLGHGIAIHPGHHQDFARIVLLGDGGHEAAGIEADLGQHGVDRGGGISGGNSVGHAWPHCGTGRIIAR